MEIKKGNVEKIGFWLTILCAIHCLATPVLLTFLPIFGSRFSAFEAYENWIVLLSLFLAFLVLFNDYAKHKNKMPLILLALAFVLKAADALLKNITFEIFLIPAISVLIISSYYLNWKHKKACQCTKSL